MKRHSRSIRRGSRTASKTSWRQAVISNSPTTIARALNGWVLSILFSLSWASHAGWIGCDKGFDAAAQFPIPDILEQQQRIRAHLHAFGILFGHSRQRSSHWHVAERVTSSAIQALTRSPSLRSRRHLGADDRHDHTLAETAADCSDPESPDRSRLRRRRFHWSESTD